MIRVICIFSRILGGKTFSRKLDDVLAGRSDIEVERCSYDESIYAEFNPPSYLKVSNALEAAWRIDKRFREKAFTDDKSTIYFFQSYQLTIPFRARLPRSKAILALDATPMTAVRGNDKERFRLNSLLTRALNYLVYRKRFREIDFFLARTEHARKSLQLDYGIHPSRIEVTYLPMELSPVGKVTLNTAEKLRLLVVGNDIYRKGIPFAIELFDKYLFEFCELLIVSTDARISELPTLAGVTYINGCDKKQLESYYKSYDVLLFPSYKDELGLVLCEALAHGMVLIARNSSAQNEIVLDGVNGYLMDYDSHHEEWAGKLRVLNENRERLRKMGEESLSLANELLSPKVFVRKVNKAIDFLLEMH